MQPDQGTHRQLEVCSADALITSEGVLVPHLRVIMDIMHTVSRLYQRHCVRQAALTLIMHGHPKGTLLKIMAWFHTGLTPPPIQHKSENEKVCTV
jgi:hypothetical protein